MTRTITVHQLIHAGACADQVKLFKRKYGNEVRITIKACVAVTDKFDFVWATDNLLSPAARDAYDAAVEPARDAYDAAVEAARGAYDAAIRPARDAYVAATEPAWDAYDAAVKPAQDAYDAAIKPARAALNRARTAAFARAYNGDKS